MRWSVVKNLGLLVLAVVGLAPVLPARAAVIVQVTSGAVTAAQVFFGQFFTTPGGGPWHNITFNFFSAPSLGSTPVAAGTAYLFSSAYNGTPSGLSSASDLATSTGIASGSYIFGPSLTFQPNTQYFLYEDTSLFPVGFASAAGSGGTEAASSGDTYSFESIQQTSECQGMSLAASFQSPPPSVYRRWAGRSYSSRGGVNNKTIGAVDESFDFVI